MTFPVFAAGDVLRASDMNAVGLWLVKTQTIGTTVSSVTVSDVFSSTYDNYVIKVSGGVGSTTLNLNLTLGSAAANYYNMRAFVDYATATYGDGSTNNGASFGAVGCASAQSISVDLELINPFLTTRTHMASRFPVSVAGGEGIWAIGYLNDAVSYTAFTLTCSTGTLTGGTIRVYGYRN